MMKIGLYIESLPDYIDYSAPQNGNPGIGGTQYCMLLLAHYLKSYRPTWKIIIYSQAESIYPREVEFVRVNNDIDALEKSIDLDILIIKNPAKESMLYKKLCTVEQNIIVWVHNYILSDYSDYLYHCKSVKSVVFVGKQLYDRYIDTDLITKSTYIYNIVPDCCRIIKREMRPWVIFLGAIIPVKGFHVLASMWPRILNECPNAQLHVLGSGKVYSRDCHLGKYNIAESAYEMNFMKYLTDSNGNIGKSVVFHGIVGQEKYDIFQKAMVGVVNPSGRTETFGMGIVEMNSACLPVVTINRNGYPDTVINGKNGFLGNNKTEIENHIIHLLKDCDCNMEMGKSAKETVQRFSPSEIIPLWLELFNKLNEGCTSFPYIRYSTPINNNLKYIRVVNRFLRFNMHLKFFPSFLSVETFIYKLLCRIKQ